MFDSNCARTTLPTASFGATVPPTVYNKYFVDEIYAAAVVNPLVSGSREVLWKGMDAAVIDGAVNGVGNRSQRLGGVLKLLQSGNIRSYAVWVLLGSVLVLVAMGLAGGVR